MVFRFLLYELSHFLQVLSKMCSRAKEKVVLTVMGNSINLTSSLEQQLFSWAFLARKGQNLVFVIRVYSVQCTVLSPG